MYVVSNANVTSSIEPLEFSFVRIKVLTIKRDQTEEYNKGSDCKVNNLLM